MATQAPSSQLDLPQELRERLCGEVPEWEQLRRAMPALGLKPLPNGRRNKYGIGYYCPGDRGASTTLAAYSAHLDAKQKRDTDRQIEVLLNLLKADPATFDYSGWAHSAASEILLGLEDSSDESERKAKNFLAKYWRIRLDARVEARWRRLERLRPVLDALEGEHSQCCKDVVRWIQGKFAARPQMFNQHVRYRSAQLPTWTSEYRKDPKCNCKCLTQGWLETIFASFEQLRSRGSIHDPESVKPADVLVEAVARVHGTSARTLSKARHRLRPKRIRARKP